MGIPALCRHEFEDRDLDAETLILRARGFHVPGRDHEVIERMSSGHLKRPLALRNPLARALIDASGPLPLRPVTLLSDQ
jgi:hypothetical protein